jgi:hypothetical protein
LLQPQQTKSNIRKKLMKLSEEKENVKGKRKGKIRKIEKQNPEKCCLQETKTCGYIAYEKHGKTRIHFRSTFVHFLRRCSSFLNWFLLLSCNTRRRAGGHVPCRRKEGALGPERRCARISPQIVYSWSYVLKLFRRDFLR